MMIPRLFSNSSKSKSVRFNDEELRTTWSYDKVPAELKDKVWYTRSELKEKKNRKTSLKRDETSHKLWRIKNYTQFVVLFHAQLTPEKCRGSEHLRRVACGLSHDERLRAQETGGKDADIALAEPEHFGVLVEIDIDDLSTTSSISCDIDGRRSHPPDNARGYKLKSGIKRVKLVGKPKQQRLLSRIACA